MFRHYLKVTLRSLSEQKQHVILNTLGLVAGVACVLLTLLYVQHELSYDQDFADADRVYRVYQDLRGGRFGDDAWSFTGVPMGERLADELTEVEAHTRVHIRSTTVSTGNGASTIRKQEGAFAFADAAFFDVLSFPLAQGDPRTALDTPNGVVLTQEKAMTYFGRTDVVGESVELDNRVQAIVTGVLAADLPSSHLTFDFLGAADLMHDLYRIPAFSSWWWPSVSTYVKLRPGTNVEQLNASVLPAFIARHREAEVARYVVPQLQSIQDIRLYGNPGSGTITTVFAFGLIALFVLLIACINFASLATAQAQDRAKEVAVRKALGARVSQLIGQFLGESLVTTSFAVAVALGVTYLLLPLANATFETNVALPYGAPWFWLSVVAIMLGVAVLAGSYPALYLSRLAPDDVLRGAAGTTSGASSVRLRRGLVMTQLVISTALVICATAAYTQISYVANKDLGFNAENLVVLPTARDARVLRGFSAFQQELSREPMIEAVTAASGLPGLTGVSKMPGSVGSSQTRTASAEEETQLPVFYVDKAYPETMQLRLADGRTFADFGDGADEAFLLNEAAVRSFNLDRVLGEPVKVQYGEGGNTVYQKDGRVIGVVKDFHTGSLRDEIGPVALTLASGKDLGRLRYILVRLPGHDLQQELATLRSRWTAAFPHRPFESRFLSDYYASAYADTDRVGTVVSFFTLLAILTACIGLFGMMSLTTQRRAKEIALRKAIGATSGSIVRLLSGNILKMVAISFVLAAPIAYLVANAWLSDFAYRVPLRPPLFLGAAVLVAILALSVTLYWTLRAAWADPVLALRAD